MIRSWARAVARHRVFRGYSVHRATSNPYSRVYLFRHFSTITILKKTDNTTKMRYHDGMKTIVTHSGSFHTDDVYAIATLLIRFGSDECAIVRSRDEEVIKNADIVVDVGGDYDPARSRFDHHQIGAPQRDNGIPYAAFGLVWKEFGPIITGDKEVSETIDRVLAQPIDAGDNGVSLYTLIDANVTPYELYQIIGSFAPVWQSGGDKDQAFLEAVDLARAHLLRVVAHEQSAAAMRNYVAEGYAAAAEKKVLIFEIPVSALPLIEYQDVSAVVCPDNSEADSHWTATAVRKDRSSFASRVLFPESWRGLRDQELAAASGVPDAVFCHKSGFLFVARGKEGALKAAGEAG